jgi:hypothetical protein
VSKAYQAPDSAPLSIRFDGVDQGSAKARALAEKHIGEINQFYLGARQQRDLSGNDQFGVNKQLPDGGSLHYRYNNGLETMDVRLAEKEPETFESPDEPQAKERKLPDFCVVDLVIPSSAEMRFDFIAVCVKPDGFAGTWETDSIHWTDSSEVLPLPYKPPFRYARSLPADYVSTIGNRVSSLAFDLRRGGPRAEYIVDIYGKVTPDNFPIIGYDTTSGDTYTTTYTRELAHDWTGWLELDSRTSVQYEDSGFTFVPPHFIPSTASNNSSAPYVSASGDSSASSGWSIPSQDIDDLEAAWSVLGFGVDELTTDPTSGLVTKQRRSFVGAVPSNENIAGTCPVHHIATRHTDWTVTAAENYREWNIIPPGTLISAGTTTPIYATTFETDADIVYGFYYDTSKLKVGATQHQDRFADSIASIWAPAAHDPTDRKALPGTAHIVYTPNYSNPGNYEKIGRLRVRRDPAKVEFTPA